MIVQTRYRDVSPDDFLKCVKPEYHAQFKRDVWEQRRGKFEISVITPQRSERPFVAACDGPFYELADQPGYVCVHIAEIGD